MKIRLINISKKFGSQLIIKNFNYTFESNKMYAITGDNGKGKSTLLKLISGFLSVDKGEVIYEQNNETVTKEEISSVIAIQAPYIDLSEDLTLGEWFDFYTSYKSLIVSKQAFFEEVKLDENKLISSFSTGMKQRFKLGLAFHTQASILLLDEPCSFLDDHWRTQYKKWIEFYKGKKTIILSSNDSFEYEGFETVIKL
jgi:ABC-type multidrug transport system ATPase subunit